MRRIQQDRAESYGAPESPKTNIRASEDFGVPNWIGVMVRANDKIRRIQQHARLTLHGLPNSDPERIDDAFIDAANYLLLALYLLRESEGRLEPCES